jgi:hypothetical protein
MAQTQPSLKMGNETAVEGVPRTPTLAPPSAAAGKGVARTPTAAPPTRIGGAGLAGAVGTVWNNNQTVNALWSINEDRNSWVGIAGVGWVKLSTASDPGVVALTALAAHAYQTQHVINYRTEDDGMIHEIYAW